MSDLVEGRNYQSAAVELGVNLRHHQFPPAQHLREAAGAFQIGW
jgi:hypothetical protein